MDQRWILDQMFSLGKFDAAQGEQIKQLNTRLQRLEDRGRVWMPIVFLALTALCAIGGFALSLYSFLHPR